MGNNYVPALCLFEREKEDMCKLKKSKIRNTVRCKNQRSYTHIRMVVFRPERHVLSCRGILSKKAETAKRQFHRNILTLGKAAPDIFEV